MNNCAKVVKSKKKFMKKKFVFMSLKWLLQHKDSNISFHYYTIFTRVCIVYLIFYKNNALLGLNLNRLKTVFVNIA